MTVTYNAHVANSSFAVFLRLLLRWRGSIYKLLWKEFLVFAGLYCILSLVFRLALNEDSKKIFVQVVVYCETYSAYIPLSFILGFYVSIVLSRWWEQYTMIPWPDRTAVFLTAILHGQDERGRMMRRTIMRYLNLVNVITLSSISPTVKKRFPTFTHMTDAGFMLPNEQKILEGINLPHNKYWIPIIWSTSLVTRARKEGRIKDDFGLKTLLDEINAFRGKCGGLFDYDWITVPLVFTQVVTLAVYIFFTSCLMGRQFIKKDEIDIYVPCFTFLQFFFYMGWLKVAESLLNPFGDDDDDFELNWIIDRNLRVTYMMVDEMHQEHPELIKDQYWDTVEFELPYTAAAAEYRPTEPFLGSAMKIELAPKEKEFMPLGSVLEEPSELTSVTAGDHEDFKGQSSRWCSSILSRESENRFSCSSLKKSNRSNESPKLSRSKLSPRSSPHSQRAHNVNHVEVHDSLDLSKETDMPGAFPSSSKNDNFLASETDGGETLELVDNVDNGTIASQQFLQHLRSCSLSHRGHQHTDRNDHLRDLSTINEDDFDEYLPNQPNSKFCNEFRPRSSSPIGIQNDESVSSANAVPRANFVQFNNSANNSANNSTSLLLSKQPDSNMDNNTVSESPLARKISSMVKQKQEMVALSDTQDSINTETTCL